MKNTTLTETESTQNNERNNSIITNNLNPNDNIIIPSSSYPLLFK